MRGEQSVRLAVDIGGTFTDVVLELGDVRHSAKVLTNVQNPELGLLDGVRIVLDETNVSPADIDVFVHGTTLATNALIERKVATTALITTAGFEDILELGYEKRFDHYDLMIDMPPAIVPAELRFGVTERLAQDGAVLSALDEDQLVSICAQLRAANVEAVAIGFLHAYAHSEHEKRARDIVRRELGEGVTICVSHEVCPEIREYERFSTTCANASVRPLIEGYLTRLASEMQALGIHAPLFLMMSGGGLTTLESASRFPIRLVESGPAGGAILASHIAKQCDLNNVLSFDMGGTTAKICLIADGVPERARHFEIARTYRDTKGSGWPVRIPVIEMVEIGAGGGSIARIDAMQRIKVGPDSAGSEPGPVCYGRGGELATVTDANLTLGKIDPAYFAGGKLPLYPDAAGDALSDQIGAPLGLDKFWPAAGVVEIVEENMANAARVHAIERGRDIASSTMIAFGGGAPLHLCRLAEKLSIDKMIVPSGAGVGSAIGFLRAPISYEVTRSFPMPLDGADVEAANHMLAEMEKEAGDIVRPAAGDRPVEVQRVVDIRYQGQGHELQVVLPQGVLNAKDAAGIHDQFEAQYLAIYGVTLDNVPSEIVTWSVTVLCEIDDGVSPTFGAGDATAIAPRSHRPLFDGATGDMLETPVYWRFDLPVGAKISGPAIIAEHETSTIVTSQFDAEIDAHSYIVLQRKEMVQ